MADFIVSILAFLAAVTLLVFIHEYGHYATARALGVKVLAFSIGFGRTIWERTDKNGVRWIVAAIPLGGYVRMLDTREGDVPKGQEHLTFDKQHWRKRALIALAGPVANLVFAILAWSALFMSGVHEFRPVMGASFQESRAHRAGALPSDIASAVNGTPVKTMSDMQMALVAAAMDRTDAVVTMDSPDGSKRDIVLSTDNFPFDGKVDAFRHFGWVSPGPQLPATVSAVRDGAPAKAAGMAAGDSVISANGTPISLWSEFVAVVSASPGKSIDLVVRSKDGKERKISVVPMSIDLDGRKVGRLGVSSIQPTPASLKNDPAVVLVSLGPVDAVLRASEKARDVVILSLKSIRSLVTGMLPLDAISGPVGIADQAGKAFDAGSVPFLSFLAFISLSLFVMNMLPLPVLDGGHIVFCLYEALTGRPVGEQAHAVLVKAGAFLLVCLMAVSLWGDISRLLG